MTVYSTSVLGLTSKAKVPAKKEVPKLQKKSKMKKDVTIEEAVEEAIAEPVVKEKKPRSEKQLAADEKRRETMKAKHAEMAKPVKPVKPAKIVNTKPKVVKSKIRESPEVLPNDENVPPPWFKQYVKNVKTDENRLAVDRKPREEVKMEAAVLADEKWVEPGVRQKVEKEVSSHQQRMYNMMFKR